MKYLQTISPFVLRTFNSTHVPQSITEVVQQNCQFSIHLPCPNTASLAERVRTFSRRSAFEWAQNSLSRNSVAYFAHNTRWHRRMSRCRCRRKHRLRSIPTQVDVAGSSWPDRTNQSASVFITFLSDCNSVSGILNQPHARQIW